MSMPVSYNIEYVQWHVFRYIACGDASRQNICAVGMQWDIAVGAERLTFRWCMMVLGKSVCANVSPAKIDQDRQRHPPGIPWSSVHCDYLCIIVMFYDVLRFILHPTKKPTDIEGY